MHLATVKFLLWTTLQQIPSHFELSRQSQRGPGFLGNSETHLLQYPILTTWRQQGVGLELRSFQLRRLQSGCWPVPLPVLDGCRSFPPPASFSENQSWETVSSRCLTLPTTPRSSQRSLFSDGKTDEPRREDLCKVPQATVLEPTPLPSFSASTPWDRPYERIAAARLTPARCTLLSSSCAAGQCLEYSKDCA